MTYNVQQALKEIMEIPPMYRRDFIIEYLRKYLPKEDAKGYLIRKAKVEYIARMMCEGYVTKHELLEKIGRERIGEYYHIMSTLS